MIIAVLPLVLLVWLFHAKRPGLREAFLKAATICGTFVLVVTELLSPFNALTFPVLLVVWSAFAIGIGLLIYRSQEKSFALPQLSWVTLGPVIAALALTLVVALAAEPNNWDSMTYHLARVVNWVQRGSVASYPTHITKQLSLSPWAEYAILHLQILSGGSDRWANLVQWISLAGSAIAVSLILKELKLGFPLQILGATLVCTTPMVILQSTSTQNDLACAMWLAAFVFFAFRIRENWIFATLCLALAFATKATAAIYAPPFVLMALIRDYKVSGARAMLSRAAITLVCIALLNAGYFARNYQLYGHPMGDPVLTKSVNMEMHDPVHVASNLFRNLSLHWGTPMGRGTVAVERMVTRVHEMAGVNVSEEGTTWGTFYVPPASAHEDDAGNFLMMWLILIAFVTALVQRRKAPQVWSYAWQVGLGFLLFSVALKWQPWHSRLEVPFFVLSSAFVAAVLGSMLRSARSVAAAGWMLFVAALPWLLFNATRPLLALPLHANPSDSAGTISSVVRHWVPRTSVLTSTREHQLFANAPRMEVPYKIAIAQAMSGGCRQLGLVLTANSWEYPVHYLARKIDPRVQVHHVYVANQSASLNERTAPPCAILAIQAPIGDPRIWPTVPIGGNFVLTYEAWPVRVYKPRVTVSAGAPTFESRS